MSSCSAAWSVDDLFLHWLSSLWSSAARRSRSHGLARFLCLAFCFSTRRSFLPKNWWNEKLKPESFETRSFFLWADSPNLAKNLIYSKYIKESVFGVWNVLLHEAECDENLKVICTFVYLFQITACCTVLETFKPDFLTFKFQIFCVMRKLICKQGHSVLSDIVV